MTDTYPIPPADDPEAALASGVALRRLADRLERRAVREAIEQGWTWARIAQALSVSKQAAHKRFIDIVKDRPAEGDC